MRINTELQHMFRMSPEHIRDYFAGQVLLGVMSNDRLFELTVKLSDKREMDHTKYMSEYCYEIADGMLKTKDKE